MLAGTAAGTVFGFALDLSDRRDVGGVLSQARDSRPGTCGRDVLGKAQLGRILFKFEHTSRAVDGISCSREQVRGG